KGNLAPSAWHSIPLALTAVTMALAGRPFPALPFSAPLQVVFEGIRGRGIEGDIAIDDIAIVEGECTKSDYVNNHIPSGAVRTLVHIRILPIALLLSVLSHQRPAAGPAFGRTWAAVTPEPLKTFSSSRQCLTSRHTAAVLHAFLSSGTHVW
ncbi:hypothetical protein lerEdw1_013439, partial [Lerista edwardsae]